MTDDTQVLDAIFVLCGSIGRLNDVIDDIIADIEMDDEERAALKVVSNDLRAAYRMLQAQCIPHGKLS